MPTSNDLTKIHYAAKPILLIRNQYKGCSQVQAHLRSKAKCSKNIYHEQILTHIDKCRNAWALWTFVKLAMPGIMITPLTQLFK